MINNSVRGKKNYLWEGRVIPAKNFIPYNKLYYIEKLSHIP